MRKKFLTRRGFTIVEVMVAFVIFAIMAGMVATILSGTMQAKRENTALEAEIAGQQSVYYTKTQPRDYDESSTDTLTFDFTDASTVTIGYSVANPNADDAGNEIALEYFVGNVNYDVMYGKQTTQKTDNQNNEGGSVADYFEKTGIYGSNGISSIGLILQRDSSYTEGYRYLIAAKALGDVDDQYDMFKQFRLLFPGSIEKFGYCNYQQSGSLFRDIGTVTPTGYNVTLTNANTIRIAATQTSSTQPITSSDSGYKSFYVVLDSELETISSSLNPYEIFGYCDTDKTAKAIQSDGSYLFTQYEEIITDEEGNIVKDDEGNPTYKTYPNIFAATEKDKTQKTDEKTE